MPYRFGHRYRYEPPSQKGKGALLFWPERGSICILDERFPEESSEHFIVLSVREWLENIRAINAQVHREKYADERQALHQLIESGIACAREAKRQGDPCDPHHLRDMLLQRRKSMLMAGKGDYFRTGALSADMAPEAALLPPLGGVDRERRAAPASPPAWSLTALAINQRTSTDN